MNIPSMIKELQNILPPENFKTEPQNAMQVMKEFEKKYGMQTEFFLRNPKGVSEEDCNKWLSAYEFVLLFGGKV